MTNIYVSIFATKEAIDQNNIVSTLKHKYPWGSPYQIPINGEQYWESTYNLIDEGGGVKHLHILRIAPSNHSVFEEAA